MKQQGHITVITNANGHRTVPQAKHLRDGQRLVYCRPDGNVYDPFGAPIGKWIPWKSHLNRGTEIEHIYAVIDGANYYGRKGSDTTVVVLTQRVRKEAP